MPRSTQCCADCSGIRSKRLFDAIDKQCQQVVDAVTPAIARMELHGIPIDVVPTGRRSHTGKLNWPPPRKRSVTHRRCATY